MNTLGRFFTITAKGDNLVLPVDFPALLKRVHHSGSKFFPFKVDPIPEVGKLVFIELSLLKVYQFSLNLVTVLVIS